LVGSSSCFWISLLFSFTSSLFFLLFACIVMSYCSTNCASPTYVLLPTCHHRFVCSYFACMYISHLLHFSTSSTCFALLFTNCLHACLRCFVIISLVTCVEPFLS
jgi:hypothetical protein